MAYFKQLPHTKPDTTLYQCTVNHQTTIQLDLDSQTSPPNHYGKISVVIHEGGRQGNTTIAISALTTLNQNAQQISALNFLLNSMSNVNTDIVDELQKLIQDFWKKQTPQVSAQNTKKPYYLNPAHVAELIHPELTINNEIISSNISYLTHIKPKETLPDLTDEIILANENLFQAIVDCDLLALQKILAHKTLADFNKAISCHAIASTFKSNKSTDKKIPILKLLIEKGAIYLHHFLNDEPPLEHLKALLSAGADVNINNKGNTALHVVVPHGMKEHISLLLDYNIDINRLDEDNGYGTALHICLANENVNYAIAFIKMVNEKNKKIDYSARDKEGKTPLIIAAKIMSLPAVKEIIAQDSQCINLADNQSRTALHFACALGQLDIVTALLKAGANLSACDKNNKTPLDYASFPLPLINSILFSISIDPNRDVKAISNTIYDASAKPFTLPLTTFAQFPIKKNAHPNKRTNAKMYGEVLLCSENKTFVERGLNSLKPQDRDCIQMQLTQLTGKSVAQACLEGQKKVREYLEKYTASASKATVIASSSSFALAATDYNAATNNTNSYSRIEGKLNDSVTCIDLNIFDIKKM